MIRGTALRRRVAHIPFPRFVAVSMSSSSSDSVDDSNPSVPPQAGGGKKAPQGGTGWMPSLLRRFFSQPAGERNREYYEKLPLDSKRELYTCGSKYLTLDKIQTWEEFQKGKPRPRFKSPSPFPITPVLNKKVSLWQGDITRLEIDAIVNAANSSLLGGGGVDGAIHRAAGYSLRDECAMLGGCSTGDTKITSGHRLPAKYILHTVGPVNGDERKLRSCYTTCLQLTLENKIQSVAFCCIATGVYGYPNKAAAHVALETTRKWLEINADKVERVIFCVFLNVDYSIYQQLLHYYFPVEAPTGSDDHDGGDNLSPQEDTDGRRDSDGDEGLPCVPKLQRSVTEPAHSTSTKPSQPESQQQQPQMKQEQQNTEQTSHAQEQEEAAADEVPREQETTGDESSQEQNRMATEQMVDKTPKQQLSREQEEMVTESPEDMTQEHNRCEEQMQQENTEQQEGGMEEEKAKKPRITAV